MASINLKNEINLTNDTLITSKTDLQGKITYGNKDFIKFSGYSEMELLGKPHNIIRHPKMPKVAFKLLWETIKNGNEFFAFVCNLSKKKQTYWVFANVTPSFDHQGNIIGYYSVRRRPSKEGVETLIGIYQECLQIENKASMNVAQSFIMNLLKSKNISWNELMINFQAQSKITGYR